MKTRRNLGVETMKKGALLLLALLFFVACTRKAHYIHSGGGFSWQEDLFQHLSEEERNERIDALSKAVTQAAEDGTFVAVDEEFIKAHGLEGWNPEDLEKVQVVTHYKKTDDDKGISQGDLPPFILCQFEIRPDEEFMREATEEERMEMMGAIFEKSVEYVQKGDETLNAEKLAKEVEGLSKEEAEHLSITALYTRETPEIKAAIEKGLI